GGLHRGARSESVGLQFSAGGCGVRAPCRLRVGRPGRRCRAGGRCAWSGRGGGRCARCGGRGRCGEGGACGGPGGASGPGAAGAAGATRAANAAGPASAAGPCRSDLLYARDLSAQNAEVSTNWNRADLQSLMWRSVGLIRQESALARAESELASWATMFPQTLGEQEDRNLLLVARLLTHAARARRTSLGAHFRADAAAPRLPERAGAATSASAPASTVSSAPAEVSAGDLSPAGASPAAGAGVDMTLEFH